MVNLYQIHRYQNDTFQYVVAATNKCTEEQVRKDVERFNAILSNEMKTQGIKYIFAVRSGQEEVNDTNIKNKKNNVLA